MTERSSIFLQSIRLHCPGYRCRFMSTRISGNYRPFQHHRLLTAHASCTSIGNVRTFIEYRTLNYRELCFARVNISRQTTIRGHYCNPIRAEDQISSFRMTNQANDQLIRGLESLVVFIYLIPYLQIRQITEIIAAFLREQRAPR